jgi:hypothetical protein
MPEGKGIEIKTEMYQTMAGTMLTKHVVSLGGDHVHSLSTRQLWTLALLCHVELGKLLKACKVKDESVEGG